MKKVNKLLTLSLVAVGTISLSGCNWFKKKDKNTDTTDAFDFSIGLRSGSSIIEVGAAKEFVDVYDNGINSANRQYEFSSTNEAVATIDSDGKITPVAPGRVNFIATEKGSGNSHSLKREIVVESAATPATGGFNYSAKSVDERKTILGKLEKHVMDSHLTGITLFENGGLVKYSNRVQIPTKGKPHPILNGRDDVQSINRMLLFQSLHQVASYEAMYTSYQYLHILYLFLFRLAFFRSSKYILGIISK